MNGIVLGGRALAPLTSVKPKCGGWLVHGPNGSGKSTFASTVAGIGPTLYLDFPDEDGVLSFVGSPVSENIFPIQPSTLADLQDILWDLRTNDTVDCVVLDSISNVQTLANRNVRGISETDRSVKVKSKPMSQADWGASLSIMSDVISGVFGLRQAPSPKHVVVVAQTITEVDEMTGTRFYTPNVQKGARPLLKQVPAYSVYCDVIEDITKDPNEYGRWRHVVRFGADPDRSMKGKVPFALHGKIPPVLGLGKSAPDMAQLSRVLGLAGTSVEPRTTEGTNNGDH